MDAQTLLNILLGLFSGVLGFLLRIVWESVKDLQAADKELVSKVNTMEVLVAGHYLTREEFAITTTSIDRKLNKIIDRLDGKADKLS